MNKTELINDKRQGGGAWITAVQGAVCKKGGGSGGVGGLGSPLTLLPPGSNLSRATQVLAKERKNQTNPKPDRKILECYS